MEPMKPMQPMKPMEPMQFKETPAWWPKELGSPNSSGSQNDIEYAYFAASRRLLLRDGQSVTTYDTGDYEIQGVSQASDSRHAKFTSRQGPVDVTQLKRL